MTLKALPAFGARYRQVLSSFPDHTRLENLCALEAMTAVRVGFRCVSFVSLPVLVRGCLLSVYSESLQKRILLPESGLVAALLRRSLGAQNLASMPARDFVPVLLSYMAEPKRIVLAGSERARLSAARDFIRTHVPWHQVYAVHLQPEEPKGVCARLVGEVVGVKPHLVLVDSASMREEMLLEQGLSAAYDGLAILAPSFFAACPPAQSNLTGLDASALTIYSPNKFSLS